MTQNQSSFTYFSFQIIYEYIAVLYNCSTKIDCNGAWLIMVFSSYILYSYSITVSLHVAVLSLSLYSRLALISLWNIHDYTGYVVVFFNDSLSSSFVKERGLLAVWESTSGEESFKLFVCPFSCWGAQKTVHLCLWIRPHWYYWAALYSFLCLWCPCGVY